MKRKAATGREQIATIALDNGLSPIPSAANFVSVDCGGDGAFCAEDHGGLPQRHIFIRKPMTSDLNRCIRASVGLTTNSTSSPRRCRER